MPQLPVRVGDGSLQPEEPASDYRPHAQFRAGSSKREQFPASRHEDVRFDDLAMSEPHGGRDVRPGVVTVRCEHQVGTVGIVRAILMPRADGDDVQRFGR